MVSRKEIRLEFLRRDLQNKEEKRVRVWADFWWVLWIFIPVLGWIIMIVIIFRKTSQKSQLDSKCRKLRDEIKELQDELLEEKIDKRNY